MNYKCGSKPHLFKFEIFVHDLIKFDQIDFYSPSFFIAIFFKVEKVLIPSHLEQPDGGQSPIIRTLVFLPTNKNLQILFELKIDAKLPAVVSYVFCEQLDLFVLLLLKQKLN